MKQHIEATKQHRKDLDDVLQRLKRDIGDLSRDQANVRRSRERSIAVTKLQEAIMWLGMDLKAINEEVPGECPNPYPQSYNSASSAIEPTADGLKL